MSKKWELISFIKGSSYRKKVLEALNKPKTPTELSRELKINRAHISRSLIDLCSKNLVICLTPKIKKTRLYQRTKVSEGLLTHFSK